VTYIFTDRSVSIACTSNSSRPTVSGVDGTSHPGRRSAPTSGDRSGAHLTSALLRLAVPGAFVSDASHHAIAGRPAMDSRWTRGRCRNAQASSGQLGGKRRSVSDGDSSNRARYAAEKRPMWNRPNRDATAWTVVVSGEVCSNAWWARRNLISRR
jgi:hypothetical protein